MVLLQLWGLSLAPRHPSILSSCNVYDDRVDPIVIIDGQVGNVQQKAHPEGCMAEGYYIELSIFLSMWIPW